MRDYVRRFFIVGIIALCISLLFLGGKHSQAEQLTNQIEENDWIWPTEGVVTDLYGTREGTHKGIDIAGSLGTEVHATASGVVSKSYYSSSYGHVVFLRHDGEDIETVYAHLNKRLVKEGEIVKQGDTIGEMGNTGRSTGVHLHFEIHQNEWTYEKDNAIDPALAFGELQLGKEITGQRAVVQVPDDNYKTPIVEMKKLEWLEDTLQYVNASLHEEASANNESKREDENRLVYEVIKGDTLWGIAKRHDVTVASIVKINQLSSDVIFPDQKLMIEQKEDNRLVSNELLAKKMKHVLDERRALHMLQQ